MKLNKKIKRFYSVFLLMHSFSSVLSFLMFQKCCFYTFQIFITIYKKNIFFVNYYFSKNIMLIIKIKKRFLKSYF